MAKKKKSESEQQGPTHVSHGNVLDDLGFSAEEAAILKLKSDLHSQILGIVQKRKLTARQLEQILGQPQPRISELLCGKLSKMSAEKLVGYLSRLGVPVAINTKRERTKAIAKAELVVESGPIIYQPQINVYLTVNNVKTERVGEPAQLTNIGSENTAFSLLGDKKGTVH